MLQNLSCSEKYADLKNEWKQAIQNFEHSGNGWNFRQNLSDSSCATQIHSTEFGL